MNTKLKKIAGQQLQLLRLEKNLTQEQMSEKLNLSTSAYCKIEYGETDLTLTYHLHKLYHIHAHIQSSNKVKLVHYCMKVELILFPFYTLLHDKSLCIFRHFTVFIIINK